MLITSTCLLESSLHHGFLPGWKSEIKAGKLIHIPMIEKK